LVLYFDSFNDLGFIYINNVSTTDDLVNYIDYTKLTRLRIGGHSYGQQLNGHIKKIIFYKSVSITDVNQVYFTTDTLLGMTK
jgi:hypothetical protein